MSARKRLTRRQFHRRALAGLSAATIAHTANRAPAQVTADSLRPSIEWGIASGDVDASGAVIWSRTDRPARMHLEIAPDENFREPQRLIAADCLEADDFTGKYLLSAPPAGQTLHYRVRFESLEHRGAFSDFVAGRFAAPPRERRAIRFLWSGDTAGQGWGIDPARGGMRMFDVMRQRQPDFFINSGDTVYADGPLAESVALPDGGVWQNIVTPEKSKVAETLAEYRGQFRYNHLDEHFRRFHAEVPTFVQWDDHEVVNNWYPRELLDDDRYHTKSVALLAARAKRAFFEYQPIRRHQSQEIFRQFSYGPDVQLFFLDMRSDRGDNSPNRQAAMDESSAILGSRQLAWLKSALAASTATWKVICADMPLGLVIGDGRADFEGVANRDGGAPLGRELEIADLLSHLKQHRVRNTIWLTADVHYAASHYYDPNRARFQDFDPFWEFVSGPIHAGTFGPNQLDDTFGPQVEFSAIPPGQRGGLGPAAGLQFFGQIDIDGQTGALTVGHYNLAGEKLWERKLEPVG